MANTEMGDLLHQRMADEQAKFRDWLLTQPPDVILDHACEYTVREDIMMELSVLKLPEAQARVLLKSRTPLADVYKEWNSTETHHMEDLRDVIEARADAVIQAEKEKAQDHAR